MSEEHTNVYATPKTFTAIPPTPEQEFRDTLWRAMIMVVKAYAKRYGYGRIEIIKD